MKLVSLPHDIVPKDDDSLFVVSLKAHYAWVQHDRMRMGALMSLTVIVLMMVAIDIMEPSGVWLITAAIIFLLALVAFLYYEVKSEKSFNAADALHSILDRMAAEENR